MIYIYDMEIKINKLKCVRCGHQWIPRTKNIITCPSCRSPYWNRKKKEVDKNETKNIREKVNTAKNDDL